MKKHYLLFMMVPFFVSLPVVTGAIDSHQGNYSETLPDSAFQTGSADAAVRMLINEGIPVSVIIQAALRNGLSHDAVVGALLAAGVPREDVIRHCMLGPMSVGNALSALNAHGIPPDRVLGYLVKWEAGPGAVYETCDFMLKQGYSQADVLTALSQAGADRDTILLVVRRFNIPPATVVAVLQPMTEGFDGFGPVFSRHALPQPALGALGVSRISVMDTFNSRGGDVISPMVP